MGPRNPAPLLLGACHGLLSTLMKPVTHQQAACQMPVCNNTMTEEEETETDRNAINQEDGLDVEQWMSHKHSQNRSNESAAAEVDAGLGQLCDDTRGMQRLWVV